MVLPSTPYPTSGTARPPTFGEALNAPYVPTMSDGGSRGTDFQSAPRAAPLPAANAGAGAASGPSAAPSLGRFAAADAPLLLSPVKPSREADVAAVSRALRDIGEG